MGVVNIQQGRRNNIRN